MTPDHALLVLDGREGMCEEGERAGGRLAREPNDRLRGVAREGWFKVMIRDTLVKESRGKAKVILGRTREKGFSQSCCQ